MQYIYNKTPVSVDRLTLEIQQSSIVIALQSITVFGSEITINFKTELSESDELTLIYLVDNHTGEPLPTHPSDIHIAEIPPFAEPTYRTKRAATSSIAEVPAGESVVIDYLVTAERYASGGEMLVENRVFGDYFTAEVVDALEVIPQAYRASLCENWPTVAKYVEKEFVRADAHVLDTYPLNAKVTAGLVLRVTYHAVNSGATRRVCMNYNLTQRLA